MKFILPIAVVWLLTFLMIMLTWSLSHGDVVLYEASSGKVVETFREPIPLQPGYGQVIVPNADLIVWPVPSGCTQGQKKWALINISTIPPSFILNPILKFFHCQLISSVTDIERVAEEEIAKLVGSRPQQMMREIWQMIKSLDVLTIECPPGNTTIDCNTK